MRLRLSSANASFNSILIFIHTFIILQLNCHKNNHRLNYQFNEEIPIRHWIISNAIINKSENININNFLSNNNFFSSFFFRHLIWFILIFVYLCHIAHIILVKISHTTAWPYNPLTTMRLCIEISGSYVECVINNR